MEPDPPARRSVALTSLAWVLAVLAGGLTFAYLDPLANGTWPNAVAAAVVLVAPLVGSPPLSTGRLLTAALAWVCVGTPGSYVFGTPVAGAGILLGALLATGAVWRTATRTWLVPRRR